ncbi:MAG: GGDEF domain-containing protein [Steroidobacteraceae bacterium]
MRSPDTTRASSPLAVAFLDLDHFKKINDQFGHDADDYVLSTAAQRTQAALRDAECAGRWEGEEFLILFPGRTAAEAIKSIEQIRASGLGRCPAGRAVTVALALRSGLRISAAAGAPWFESPISGCTLRKGQSEIARSARTRGAILSAQVAYGS